jgi:hypothetical protein
MKISDIELGDALSKSGMLSITIVDDYNGTGCNTCMDKQKAMDLIQHLITVFDYTLDEIHFGTVREPSND